MTATSAQAGAVLTVNAGSSSLKFGLYQRGVAQALLSGSAEGLQPGGTPTLRMAGAEPIVLALAADGDGFQAALAALRQQLALVAPDVTLRAVAHRIVHGGTRYREPVLLDAATLDYLHTLESLAPLHQPANLAGVAAMRRAWPELPQVGCFDTAFHATLHPCEQRFALPHALFEQGLRRYGFHGLSYHYVAQQIARHSVRGRGRALLAHLGNGASMCALNDGQSVATSMGFSAVDGLMMGTRCGNLDAGLVLHLVRQGWDATRIERLLYRESGLLGVSGLSADMRTLRASDSEGARRAIALFEHRALREAGALIAVLGGVDLIAFTGGIGEHDVLLRQRLASALAYLGVKLDASANSRAVGDSVLAIHAADSTVEVWVVPTDEGRVAAEAAWNLLQNQF